MKKTIRSMVVAGILSSALFAGGNVAPVAPVAVADVCYHGFYVGGGGSIQRTYSIDKDWSKYVATQDKTNPIFGLIGYQFNCYLSVEGRISQSVYEEDYADVLTYSFFLKPQYPVTEDFTVYALLGYGVVRVKGTDGNTPAANVGKTIVDKGSFQWGFGMSYDVTESWSLFVDYTSLMKDKSITPQRLYYYDPKKYDKLSDDAINVGVIYHF